MPVTITLRLTNAEAAALNADDVHLTRDGGVRPTQAMLSAQMKLRGAVAAALAPAARPPVLGLTPAERQRVIDARAIVFMGGENADQWVRDLAATPLPEDTDAPEETHP